MKIGILDTNHFFCIYTLIELFGKPGNEIHIYVPRELYFKCIDDIGEKKNVFYRYPENGQSWTAFLKSIHSDINNHCLDYFYILPIYHDYFVHFNLVKKIRSQIILVVFNLNNWMRPTYFLFSQFIKSVLKRKIYNLADWIALDEPFHEYAVNKKKCRKRILYFPSLLFHPPENLPDSSKTYNIRFIVSGSIQKTRRNHKIIINAASAVLKQNDKFNIVFLGVPVDKYGDEVIKEALQINSHAGKEVFVIYPPDFKNEDFTREMMNGDALISSVLLNFKIDGITEQYGISKSTEASFDMIAYGIPAFLPDYLMNNKKFESSTLRYSGEDNLAEKMLFFINNPEIRKTIKNNAMINSMNYTADKVADRIIKCLESGNGEQL